MTRYRTGGYGAMVEDERGEWVRYEDVRSLLPAAWRLYKVLLNGMTDDYDYMVDALRVARRALTKASEHAQEAK